MEPSLVSPIFQALQHSPASAVVHLPTEENSVVGHLPGGQEAAPWITFTPLRNNVPGRSHALIHHLGELHVPGERVDLSIINVYSYKHTFLFVWLPITYSLLSFYLFMEHYQSNYRSIKKNHVDQMRCFLVSKLKSYDPSSRKKL